MSRPTAARLFSAALADALARLGVEHACISPGARNAPLSLALVASPIRVWVHHDERSAGFFALGLARRTGRPVAVACTSGTAAANLLPAVVEARAARVPLLVLTADRPPELRDVGAPQTIDQVALYGSAAKWSYDAAVPEAASAGRAAHLAARAWAEALDGPAGPVHLNLPFREPLTGAADGDLTPPLEPPQVVRGSLVPSERELAEVAELLAGRRCLVVAGAVTDPGFADAASELAARARIPVHADPLSGMRHGPHDRDAVVASSDLLATTGWLDRVRPEVVVRFGALPTSKPLWRWLETATDVTQVLVEPAGWRDPIAAADVVVRGDAAPTAAALGKLVGAAEDGWLETWLQADTAVQHTLDDLLSDGDAPIEPATARSLTRHASGVVGLGSSMPIREVDAYGVTTSRPVSYVANRGANGIDGAISMTLGAVAASGEAGYALVGDVAALHDLTALRSAARFDLPLTTIVLHNDGGGIFHFLPMAEHVDPVTFETALGTPHGTRFAEVAAELGVPAVRVGRHGELLEALGDGDGPRLVEVTSDRTANYDAHRELLAAVAAAVA